MGHVHLAGPGEHRLQDAEGLVVAPDRQPRPRAPLAVGVAQPLAQLVVPRRAPRLRRPRVAMPHQLPEHRELAPQDRSADYLDPIAWWIAPSTLSATSLSCVANAWTSPAVVRIQMCRTGR